MVLSGVVFVSGAIIVELLSVDLDGDSLDYALAVALEEGLEMMGVILLLAVILNQMKRERADETKPTVEMEERDESEETEDDEEIVVDVSIN